MANLQSDPFLENYSKEINISDPFLESFSTASSVDTTTQPSQSLSLVSDPDSFGNVLSRSFNESYNSFLDFAGVLG